MHSKRGGRALLDVEAFDEICLRLGLTKVVRGVPKPCNLRIGERLRLSHTTVGRARRGRPVGTKFIAAVTTHMPVKYEGVIRNEAA